MGFRLKRQKEELLDLEETLSEIRQRSFGAMKIRSRQRPMWKGKKLDPFLPPDLTLLSDDELGSLYSQFACMAQYVQQHLAARSVETAVYRKLDRMVRARVRLEKTGTNPDKEAKTDLDARTRKVGHELLVGESAQVMTDAVLQGYMIGRDATSREMTRRSWSRERNIP